MNVRVFFVSHYTRLSFILLLLYLSNPTCKLELAQLNKHLFLNIFVRNLVNLDKQDIYIQDAINKERHLMIVMTSFIIVLPRADICRTVGEHCQSARLVELVTVLQFCALRSQRKSRTILLMSRTQSVKQRI